MIDRKCSIIASVCLAHDRMRFGVDSAADRHERGNIQPALPKLRLGDERLRLPNALPKLDLSDVRAFRVGSLGAELMR